MQKQDSNPLEQARMAEGRATSWLTTMAKFLLVFLSTDFGVWAVTPGTVVGGTIAFAIFHDFLNAIMHWDAPFMRSWAYPIILLCDAAAIVQILIAWWQRWYGTPQMSYFLGIPFLTLLHIPFHLAWACNIVIVFLAGYYLRHLDHALGIWFMWGAAGMTLTFVQGTWQVLHDRTNMLDAQIYSGQVIRDVKQHRPADSPADPPDLSTGV